MVSLVCGMSSLGTSSRMGSIAGRTIGLYLFTTGVAVSLGLTAALLIGPGKGSRPLAAASFELEAGATPHRYLASTSSQQSFKAMADGQMLQSDCVCVAQGFALTRSGEASERIANWFRDMEVIVMKMVGLLIELECFIGVFALSPSSSRRWVLARSSTSRRIFHFCSACCFFTASWCTPVC